jgi:hypothetical protein
MKTVSRAILGTTAHALLVLCALSAVARADDASPTPDVPPPPPAVPPVRTPERGFLFAVQPVLPDPGHVVLTEGVGNVSRTGEPRPTGAGTMFPTLGAEVGVIPRLSLYAEGGALFIQTGNPGQLASPLMMEAGAHFLISRPGSTTWQLSVRPSWSYDFTASSTANFTATLGYQYAAFRAVSSVMASHTFQTGADPYDLQATLGATYGLPLGFRIGVEGVMEDIEEITNRGAEGGSSGFVGPTAGWEWDRLQLVAGLGFILNQNAYQAADPLLFRWVLSVRL